jgi:hypothetical protein
MASKHVKASCVVLLLIATFSVPFRANAQVTPQPYSEVLREIRLGSPATVLQRLSGACFTFELTVERREELVRESLRRDPRTPLPTIEDVLNYVARHPCESARPQEIARADSRARMFAASGEVNLNNTVRGASLHAGFPVTSEFDIVAGLRFGTTDNARLGIDTASARLGTLSVAGRLWLLRHSRGVSAYVQAGGLAQVEAFEAYGNRGDYMGLGVLGATGVGLSLSSRDMIFAEVEANTVWVMSKKESENVTTDRRSSEAVILRLGIARFWSIGRARY